MFSSTLSTHQNNNTVFTHITPIHKHIFRKYLAPSFLCCRKEGNSGSETHPTCRTCWPCAVWQPGHWGNITGHSKGWGHHSPCPIVLTYCTAEAQSGTCGFCNFLHFVPVIIIIAASCDSVIKFASYTLNTIACVCSFWTLYHN